MENLPPLYLTDITDESVFLDGLFEQHPEYIELLNDEEKATLIDVYQLSSDSDEDFGGHISQLAINHPEKLTTARSLFQKIIHSAGIERFNYTDNNHK